LVAASPTALAVLTLAGAGYLVHLGIGNLRGRRNPHRPGADVVAAGRGAFVRRGIGVSALNPKALLFFVAFLPQFARPGGAWPLPAQLAALGGLWALLGGLFYTALGYMADRALGARPALAQLITRLAGAAMIVVGLVLLGEQLLRTAGG
jgi:threonine/homoserine/homoserine lactone efflux protein